MSTEEEKTARNAVKDEMISTGKAEKLSFNPNMRVPDALNMKTGELCENFHIFKAMFNNYSVAAHLYMESEKVQVATLLNIIGIDAFKYYLTLEKSELQGNETLDGTFDLLEKNIAPTKSLMFKRYEFHKCIQAEGESFAEYLSKLKKLLSHCGYKSCASVEVLEKELLRDQISFGINSLSVREKIFDTDGMQKKKLSVEDVVLLCQVRESTSSNMNEMKDLQKNSVNKISENQVKKYKQTERKCKFCGTTHPWKKELCPAYGKKCFKCEGLNHSSKVCFKNKSEKSKVKVIKEESSSEEDESLQYLKKICSNNNNTLQARLTFRINSKFHKVNCQLDTGASVNVIGLNNYKEIVGKNNSVIHKSSLKLHSFTGDRINIIGTTVFRCIHNKKHFNLEFNIVENDHIPLLSANTCTGLGLIICKELKSESSDSVSSAEEIINKYAHVFQGIGQIADNVELEVDERISPTIQTPRRIPMSYRKMLNDEIKALVKCKIIVQEKEHTEWCSNILYPLRDGKRRLCIDPVILNTALKRPNYQFPKLEEILPEVGKAKIFSKVDLRKGYWQVKLSEKSSKLTTFWTPFGRFRFLRLPFGLCSSSEIFQMKLYEITHDLDGIQVMADDILVLGIGDTEDEAMENHNKNMNNLLKRLDEHNCKLNREKLVLCKKSVTFFGHLLSSEGLKQDPSKVEAIRRMPEPTDKKALQRFLGMTNYLAKFIPRLSILNAPLRKLLHNKESYNWTKIEKTAFHKITDEICADRTLQYLDLNKPMTIETDSSSYGIGSVLLQDDKPICYASRSLNNTERNYSQIEKEELAIVFACKKFDQYIVGNEQITVKTDHKPLVSIHKKPLHSIPKRLMHMRMALQRYRLLIVHVPGKEMVLSDTLSRAPLPEEDSNFDPSWEVLSIRRERCFIKELNNIKRIEGMPITDIRLQQLKNETMLDQNLMKLKQMIQFGWPTTIQDVDDNIKSFYKYKDQLAFEDNLIFKDDRILVPYKLRKEYIRRLHSSHNGIESTLKLAKDTVFWPGISHEIKDNVSNCQICLEFGNLQHKPPMQSHPIPEYPFEQVSMDIFETTVNGKRTNFLILVDHYSDFFEVEKLDDMTSTTIVELCKPQFSRHGFPKQVTTDGGPSFTSLEFRKFANDYDFLHSTSSPYHQQANGKAEAAVKVAKSMIKKSQKDGSDFWKSLANHRNTPNKMNSSPAQRLLSRRTRCQIPIQESKLKPEVMKNVQESVINQRKLAKHYYDRGTIQLPDLNIGQSVVVRLNPEIKRWSQGVVTQRIKDRAYIVDINGTNYRRDRVHIKPYHNNQDNKTQSSETNTPSVAQPSNTTVSSPSVRPPSNTTVSSQSVMSPRTPLTSHQPETQKITNDAPPRARYPARVRRPPPRLLDYETNPVSN